MKRVTLREDRAPYLVDEEILSDEPVIVERKGQAVAAVIPMADYEAFLAWRATLDEPWPGEPPRTPEGDLEALAAVERIRTMFPPVDAETARLLTSPGQFLLDYLVDLATNDEETSSTSLGCVCGCRIEQLFAQKRA